MKTSPDSINTTPFSEERQNVTVYLEEIERNNKSLNNQQYELIYIFPENSNIFQDDYHLHPKDSKRNKSQTFTILHSKSFNGL